MGLLKVVEYPLTETARAAIPGWVELQKRQAQEYLEQTKCTTGAITVEDDCVSVWLPISWLQLKALQGCEDAVTILLKMG